MGGYMIKGFKYVGSTILGYRLVVIKDTGRKTAKINNNKPIYNNNAYTNKKLVKIIRHKRG